MPQFDVYNRRYRHQRDVQREPEEVDFNPTQQTRLYAHSGLCDVSMSLADRHPVAYMTSTGACQSCRHQHSMTTTTNNKPDVTETDCQQRRSDNGWPFYGIVGVGGGGGGGGGAIAGQQHSLPSRFGRISKCDDVIEVGLATNRRCENDGFSGVRRTTTVAESDHAHKPGLCNRLRRESNDAWLNENGLDDVIPENSMGSAACVS